MALVTAAPHSRLSSRGKCGTPGLVQMLALLVLYGLSPVTQADESGVFRLEVPRRFDGPFFMEPTRGMTITAWTRKTGGEERTTMIQVSTLDTGGRFLAESEDGLARLNEQHVRQMVDSIALNRTGFEASAVTQVRLGGYPAARIEWQGEGFGRAMRGVSWSVIAGNFVVQFMIQGFPEEAGPDLNAAVKAVEAVTFTR